MNVDKGDASKKRVFSQITGKPEIQSSVRKVMKFETAAVVLV